MKIYIIFLFCTIIYSCKTSQQSTLKAIEKYGMAETIEDSVIQSLRQQNDLILAFATENYAWVRSTSFLILCKKNQEWTGYNYYRNDMPKRSNETGSSFNINPVFVNNTVCDSLLNFMKDSKAWTIKGDSGNGFCPNGTQSCNITDQATSRLWIISKEKYLYPSYYAPQFFEDCCPGNEERKLFLTITQKIQDIVAVQGISR